MPKPIHTILINQKKIITLQGNTLKLNFEL